MNLCLSYFNLYLIYSNPPLPQVSLICLSCSQNLRKHLHMFTSLVKNVIEDTGEQPDEKTHRVEPGRVHPHGAGVYHPPSVDVFASLKLSDTCIIRIWQRFLHIVMINDYLRSQSFSPFWRMRDMAENSKLLFMARYFRWPAPIQESPRCRVTPLEQNMLPVLFFLRKLQEFGELCIRKQGRDLSDQISRSVLSNSVTPWIAACQASLSVTNSRSSPRLTSNESVMPSSHLILRVPFSSCPQSPPASESFPMSQLFAWGGQSTGVSTWASFLPKKSQDWSPSEWTGWISL